MEAKDSQERGIVVEVSGDGFVHTITISRPAHRNAVDGPTARALFGAFEDFEACETARVAVLCGDDGTFCAGADLKAIAGSPDRMNPIDVPEDSDIGPMGPSRMTLTKPVIAAISGFAVAGGLELACWCDLRVMEEDAVMGVFCRRWGVPLIDGGTVRLPKLIGMSRAMDLILTGRPVDAKEALDIGLVNRVVPNGSARIEAEALAAQIAAFPQRCMRNDRESAIKGFDMDYTAAMSAEFQLGLDSLTEAVQGAKRFADGAGRHGAPTAPSSGTSEIKAVVFDYGGVISQSPVAALSDFEQERGLPQHSLNRFLASSDGFGALERGEIGIPEFIQRMNSLLKTSDIDNVTGEDIMERIVTHATKTRPLMLEAIDSIRDHGLKTGLLTNNFIMGDSDDFIPLVRDHFDVVVESSKVGLRKPDPKIYELLCDELDMAPSSIVYLDDIGKNLKPAKAMGMSTIRVGLSDITGIEALTTLQSMLRLPILRRARL